MANRKVGRSWLRAIADGWSKAIIVVRGPHIARRLGLGVCCPCSLAMKQSTSKWNECIVCNVTVHMDSSRAVIYHFIIWLNEIFIGIIDHCQTPKMAYGKEMKCGALCRCRNDLVGWLATADGRWQWPPLRQHLIGCWCPNE